MIKHLQFLFLPHESNNQKAKILHWTSLTFLFLLVIGFQSILTIFTRVKPGVLGYASNISTQALLDVTNQKRLESGLKALTYNDKLSQAAQQKAATMFAFNCWSHNCQDKTPWWFFKNVGYEYLYAGENLARDFGDSTAVVNAWMESPTHKDNILNNKYEEIGFSVTDGILNGEETTLVVQMFGTRESKAQIAGGQKQTASRVEGVVEAKEPTPSFNVEVLISETQAKVKPIISSFALTKAFSIFLIVFLLLIFALDTLLISSYQTIRISSKSFIHLSFFIIILLSILLSYPGQII